MQLGFYDHHRQTYGSQPLDHGTVGEFMIGDYGDSLGNGVGDGGELMIVLHDLRHLPDRSLSPRLEAFSDAYGTLAQLMNDGTWKAICDATINHRHDLSRLLIARGLIDLSHNKL